MMSRIQVWCASLLAIACVGLSAKAHETDQFTLPQGREFADLGEYLTDWFYQRIEAGVDRINEQIRHCHEGTRPMSDLQRLQRPEELAYMVNRQFPNAYDVIEGLERYVASSAARNAYPGKVVGYRDQFGNIFEKVHFPLDPRQFFRIWHASTFKAFDVYLGSDKIGHFTDMGRHYYRAYRNALDRGMSKEEAIAEAVRVGTHGPIFSERGAVGLLSAGAYSNADLAANYLGFLFYRNLTEPVMLKGQLRPPMVVRDGDYWKLAPHVRRDSDFFSYFISDHLNEALNPSYFEKGMRKAVQQALRDRTEIILNRYCDEHGERRPRQYFDNTLDRLRTYYGEYYGHEGDDTELVTIGNSCFTYFDPDAPVDARNAVGDTPLHVAVALGDREAVRQLLARGADVNAQVRSDESYSPEWGNTPLHIAARDGRREMVVLLLESGADVNARNDRGVTPLHRAVNHPEIASLLIKHGAEINAADAQGRTPLHRAAFSGRISSVELLLTRGADPNISDIHGELPLHRAARSGDAAVIETLLAFGTDSEAADNLGLRPLHLAAGAGHAAAVDILIEHGCEVGARDDFGWTPLHAAARHGHETAASLLIEHGANLNAMDVNGATPLHVAARFARERMTELLVAKGADVNARTIAGKTPLHEATHSGRQAIAALLLAAGADYNIRNVSGLTPLDQARSNRQHDIASVIQTAVVNGTPTLP